MRKLTQLINQFFKYAVEEGALTEGASSPAKNLSESYDKDNDIKRVIMARLDSVLNYACADTNFSPKLIKNIGQVENFCKFICDKFKVPEKSKLIFDDIFQHGASIRDYESDEDNIGKDNVGDSKEIFEKLLFYVEEIDDENPYSITRAESILKEKICEWAESM